MPFSRPLRLSVCVCASLLLMACPSKRPRPDAGVPTGPRAVSEQEPNDIPDRAQRIEEDTQVTGALTADPSRPDIDLYLLTSSKLRVADISVSAIPGVNVVLEVLDRDRNVLVTANDGGAGAAERIPNLRVTGDIWLSVSSDHKGAGGAYTLTVLFHEPKAGAEVEPNDRAVDAFALGMLPTEQPLRVTGTLSHAADEDWFRVDLGQPNPPVIQGMTAPPPPVVSPDAGPLGAVTLDADAAVNGLGDTAVAATDGGVDAGPTGTVADAVADAAVDAGTVDEARTTLHIELTAVPGVKLELSLLSEAQAPLFNVKSKEGEGLSLRNVAVRASDTSIFVVVKSSWIGVGKDARRGASSDAPYTLTLEREAAGANAEYEPNDDLTHATPLARGGFREGFLSPRGDIDYYVVRSEEPGLTQLQLSGVDRLDLVLSVVAPAANGGTAETVLLTSNDGALKEPEVLNNVHCAPQCFVKVQGALRKVDNQMVRDYENHEQPYRLTANAIAGDHLESEPNNTGAEANPITLGSSMRGTVHPKKDLDYFKLDLSDREVKTSITAILTGILKVDVGLYLYSVDDDGKAELVQTADRAKGDAPETIRYSAEPGVYYLMVKDSKNRESNFQDSYQLSVTEGSE